MSGTKWIMGQRFTQLARFASTACAGFALALCSTASGADSSASNAETQRAEHYRKVVLPVLTDYCFDCHADGTKHGDVEFDKFKSDSEMLNDREFWFNVLKYVQSDVMPPAKKRHPSGEEKRAILKWIKSDIFQIDPAHPNPGRVTVHRLNRAEYRNTIRDLMGVDYDTEGEFPADDAGFGFDNISDVLTLSPMLLEKYLQAADAIVTKSVPNVPYVMAEQSIQGSRFTAKVFEDAPASMPATQPTSQPGTRRRQQANANNNNAANGGRQRPQPYLSMSYYKRSTASYVVTVKQDGKYRVGFDLLGKATSGEKNFDKNKARVAFTIDGGDELFQSEYGWSNEKEIHQDFEVDWKAGKHTLQFAVTPTTQDLPQVNAMELRLQTASVHGPTDPKQWVRPPNYARYFPEKTPDDNAGRKVAAKTLLTDFTTRAFRRPADAETVSRLTDLAESVWSAGDTYEHGIGKAMTAILSSPRFLFREEQALAGESGPAPLIDEYSLASRLSYFLWSSMPDEELLKLASKNELRKNIPAQLKRMLADEKAAAFTENFTGQWLEARDVVNVPIDVTRLPDSDLVDKTKITNDTENRQTRLAMQREVREYFNYIVENDRDVIEFVDSDYTFLNARLATFYGVPGIKGDELRKVTLPEGNPRGGILTMGSTLMVTSNPTRTSPVKRGLFILDNVLGMPTAPPPPDIPTLEESRGKIKDHVPTLREQLAVHREAPVCASCHNRMDPLGLALENFNAVGLWRAKEHGTDIDSSGVLITGEKFKTIQQLKKILATDNRKADFYRCLTEKLLTYALGRGMDYQDVGTIDQIVSGLDSQHGHFSALLTGVIDSPAFQRKQSGESNGSVSLAK